MWFYQSKLIQMDGITVRGHKYVPIGTWRDLPVYQSAWTDSMFADRSALSAPAVLVTAESRSPRTAESSWPAPPGNLYLCLPSDRLTVSEGVAAWLRQVAPNLSLHLSWEDGFGAHRDSDHRFVTGLAVAADSVGIDIHLNGTYAARSGHVSLAVLLGRAFDVEAVLWEVLDRL